MSIVLVCEHNKNLISSSPAFVFHCGLYRHVFFLLFYHFLFGFSGLLNCLCFFNEVTLLSISLKCSLRTHSCSCIFIGSFLRKVSAFLPASLETFHSSPPPPVVWEAFCRLGIWLCVLLKGGR